MWVSWLPNANWSIEATVGRNDGELSQAQTLFADTPGAIPVPVGTKLPIVPDVKRHLKVMYQLPRTLLGGEPYIMLRYTYTGESVNSLAGIESISVFATGCSARILANAGHSGGSRNRCVERIFVCGQRHG